jgi:uncharacterized protein (DUF2336 family)
MKRHSEGGMDAGVAECGRQMLEAPNWVGRAKAADRLAELYCGGALDASELALAEQFFRAGRFDGEVLVRRVLAEGLKRAARLPRDTALAFAYDAAEVAAPLIEASPVLDDEDLLRLLRERSPAHRLAVARRFRVPDGVARPIVATGDERLITALIDNPGATIAEDLLWRLMRDRPVRPQILLAVARRRSRLPPRIMAALIELFEALAGSRARRRYVRGERGWRREGAAFRGILRPLMCD